MNPLKPQSQAYDVAAYTGRRSQGDRHIDQAKGILSRSLHAQSVVQASVHRDQNCATDFEVVSAAGTTYAVAWRVRIIPNGRRWERQFTVRTRVYSGQQTELAKFLAGHGDLYLYSMCPHRDEPIDRWHLIDLARWRRSYRTGGYCRKAVDSGDILNANGESAFIPFNIDDFETPVALLSHGVKGIPTIIQELRGRRHGLTA